jgi:hypothetical protein
MTRMGFTHMLHKYVGLAAQCCPSLHQKHVSPHVLRHYLPFLTMSGHTKTFADKPGNRRLYGPSLGSYTRHSFP